MSAADLIVLLLVGAALAAAWALRGGFGCSDQCSGCRRSCSKPNPPSKRIVRITPRSRVDR